MTELDFVMPMFDTVQAAAVYGRPTSELREMMAAAHIGAKTFTFVAVGSVEKENRVSTLPSVIGSYPTVAWGG